MFKEFKFAGSPSAILLRPRSHKSCLTSIYILATEVRSPNRASSTGTNYSRTGCHRYTSFNGHPKFRNKQCNPENKSLRSVHRTMTDDVWLTLAKTINKLLAKRKTLTECDHPRNRHDGRNRLFLESHAAKVTQTGCTPGAMRPLPLLALTVR